MNREDALSILRHMIEIPSFSGQEGTLAKYLVETMNQLGFRSFIDEVGNAVGEWGDMDGPVILLLGHMDTVPGFIEVVQDGSLLYGRGAVDAKGPLATFICAVATLGDVHGRIIVVGAVEEEVSSSKGARHLIGRCQPDRVIIGEPSGWSNMTIGYKGQILFDYTVTRPRYHSSNPADTAVEASIHFWNQLVQYIASFDTEKSIFYRPTVHLLRCDGTDCQAYLKISCRIPPEFDISAFQSHLYSICEDGVLHIEDITPAVVTERTNVVVAALTQAIRRYTVRPNLKLKTGTSDMNIVSQHWHVPMVAYGPGDSHLDHTENEHIDIEEYLLAINVLSESLTTLLGEVNARHLPGQRIGSDQQGSRQSVKDPSLAQTQMEAECRIEASSFTDTPYDEQEEEEINRRLQALGYTE